MEEAGWAVAAARERCGNAAGAVEAARRAAALAPTDETALHRLILLLERVGDRAAAVCAYEAFAWKLQGEYELEPSAETRALVERIRAEHGQSRAATPGPQNGSSPAAGDGTSPGLVTGPTRVTVPSRAPRAGAIVTGAVVTLLVLGLVGFYLRTQARDYTLSDPHPTTVGAAPGVAVLTFAVQDSALANWREGLVDLVSLDLSGVTGLRAVDSRTLLARWREQVTGAEIPELAIALQVAERAGARYAVVGSVIANGPDLLLTAGVHEVTGRRMLGTARSQGPSDSIFTLVDRLTVEILRLILRGEEPELPRVNLARRQHRLAAGPQVLPRRRGALPAIPVPERGRGLRDGRGGRFQLRLGALPPRIVEVVDRVTSHPAAHRAGRICRAAATAPGSYPPRESAPCAGHTGRARAAGTRGASTSGPCRDLA